MALVSPTFVQNWLEQSSRYGAGAAVGMRAQVRRGRFNRRHAPWVGNDVNAIIAGGNNSAPWQAFWEETTAWVDLPNVLSCSIDQNLSNNGIAVATIEIENILPREHGTTSADIFRTIERGALAPFRGYSSPGVVGWDPALQNEWFDVLARNSQLVLYQSINGEECKTFTGLIDDIDLNANPDTITLSVRDFGQVLTDQRLFGNVKDPYLRDPVTFADRRQASNYKKVGYDAVASDEDNTGGYPPSAVLDTDLSTFWRSRIYSTADGTTYIQIRLPQGRYTSFYLHPAYDGLEMYVSLFAKDRTDGQSCTFDGAPVGSVWVDGAGGDTVPGANGGVHYVHHVQNAGNQGRYFRLGDSGPAFECGPGSILRLSFRSLRLQPDADDYRAGVRRLVASQQQITQTAIQNRWVLVDDASDVVRVLLRWAGFKEWDVQDTGVRLKRPVVFNRGMFLMDAINKVAEASQYIFLMDDPSPAAGSIGIPVFRKPTVVTDAQPYFEFADDNLLTGVRVKFTEEPLSYVIRVRGRIAKDDEPGGFLIGGGSERRVKFTFYPPWSGHGGDDRTAGILKHVVHVDNVLTSTQDCMFACYYIALQEALASCTGTVEIPAFPGITPDMLVAVRDISTGMRSRFWVAQRATEFRAGEQATWKETLTGTWVDTPDVTAMKAIINAAVRNESE